MKGFKVRLHINHTSSNESHVLDTGESTFQAPLDVFNNNLAGVRAQLGFSPNAESHVSTTSPAQPSPEAFSTPNGGFTSQRLSTIRVGSRKLPFPSEDDYRRYIEFFFDDINACHPCVNEADFRARSEKLLTIAGPNIDTHLLALNYSIFACTDILVDMSPNDQMRQPPGWQWFLAADSLVGKRKFGGRASMTLIQFLVFEASTCL